MAKPPNPKTPESQALSAALKRENLGQPVVAEQLGITPSLVSQYSTGKRPVPWDRAEDLAAIAKTMPAQISAEYRRVIEYFGLSQFSGRKTNTIIDPQMMVEALVSIIKVAEKKRRVFKPMEISEALCAIYKVRVGAYPHAKMTQDELAKFDAEVEGEIDKAWREWDGRRDEGGLIQISRKVAK